MKHLYENVAGVRLSLELTRPKKEPSPSVDWILNENVFGNGVFLANMNTGSARSPIDANEFMIVSAHHLDTPPAFEVSINESYCLRLSQKLEPTIFSKPELCYFQINLISNPLAGLNEFGAVLGINVDNVCIAPNGAIYLKPDNNKADSITIPSIQSIIDKLTEAQQQLIKRVLPPNQDVTINYSFMFSVKPTLWGFYKYFENVFQDLDNLFYNGYSLNFPPYLSEKNDKSQAINLEKLRDFQKDLSMELFPVFLKFIEKESIVKKYPEITPLIKGALGNPKEKLKEWVMDIPICFKVDPLAKVSSQGSGGGS